MYIILFVYAGGDGDVVAVYACGDGGVVIVMLYRVVVFFLSLFEPACIHLLHYPLCYRIQPLRNK